MLKIKSWFEEESGNVYSKYKHSKHTCTAEHLGAIVALFREILNGSGAEAKEVIEMIIQALNDEAKSEAENE